MASLFDGLQTQSQEPAGGEQPPPPPPPPPAVAADTTPPGGELFSGLNLGGGSSGNEGAQTAAPVSSAFGFLNSGGGPSGSAPAFPATAPEEESVFSFLNAGGDTAPVPPPPPPEVSAPPSLGGLADLAPQGPLGAPSMLAFPFVSTAQATEALAALPTESSGVRKKTRKAVMPGHASKPSDPDPLATSPVAAAATAATDEVPAPPMPQPPPRTETEPRESSKEAPPPPSPVAVDWPKPEVAAPVPAGDSSQAERTEPEVMQASPPSPVPAAAAREPEPAPAPAPAPTRVPAQAEPPPPPPPPPPQVPASLAAVVGPGQLGSFQPVSRTAAEANSVPADAGVPTELSAFFARSTERAQEPPPPPEEPSLRHAFNVGGVQQWLEKETLASTEDWKGLLEQQAGCLAQSQRKVGEVEALRGRLAQTEVEQNGLCESEQFEEAGALDALIQELKDGITRQLEEVASAARRMEALASSLLTLAQSREGLTGDALVRVQALQEQSESQQSAAAERDERRLASEAARLESERKRMDLARSHIEKDSENLKEEWQQVTEAIDQQTTEHAKERERAAAQRVQVDSEIQELQRSLDKKLEERKALTEVVESAEIRIASIRSKFEKQLSRLEVKQRRMEESRNEVEQDAQQVEQLAAELERDRQACQEGAQQRQREASEIQQEGRRLRRLRRFLARGVRLRAAWQRLLEPHRETLNQARQRWEEATREASCLAESLAGREAESAKLRSRIDVVRVQLPALEAEKKLAVASRSFKEAGRLTEDIRRCVEEEGKLEAALETLQRGLANAREEMLACRQAEEAAQVVLLEAEATCAKEELRVLRRQQHDLEALSRSAPANSSDHRLCEQEIAVLRHSQEHLSSKYGIELESLAEIPAEETADAEEDGEEAESAEGGEAPEPLQEEEPDTVCTSVAPPEDPADARPLPPPPAAEVEDPPAAQADPEELRRRRGELAARVAEGQAREQEIEGEVQAAVDMDDFDRAEELEEERKRIVLSVEEAQCELESVEALLSDLGEEATEESTAVDRSPTGADVPAEADSTEASGGQRAAEEAEEAAAAPTPNGCDPHEAEGLGQEVDGEEPALLQEEPPAPEEEPLAAESRSAPELQVPPTATTELPQEPEEAPSQASAEVPTPPAVEAPAPPPPPPPPSEPAAA